MRRLSLLRSAAFVMAVVALAAVTAPAASAHGRDNGRGDHSRRHHRHHHVDRGPGYNVQALVSDQSGVAATTDPNLVNAWGLVAGPATPWWVANNGTDTSTLYDGLGNPLPPPPTGPLVVSVPGAPTGAVFNGGPGFLVSNGTTNVPSHFIFATEGGTIQGWASGTKAVTAVDSTASGAVFKGLAISGTTLYATDFANGRVDMFDSTWSPVVTPGAFVDPYLPAGYAPFGIQALNGNIFVTYAEQQSGSTDEADGAGLGLVDEYSTTGVWEQRVGSFGGLNAPWGLAWAPAAGFGRSSGELLVGNFGDGHINAFVQRPWGQWLPDGQLTGADRHPLAIDGLWGLAFGNGTNNAPTTSLYFTAGPDGESHGLFGDITANP
jgi:uncharacterized protein (TIGR03118 family)